MPEPAEGTGPGRTPDRSRERDERTGRSASAERIRHQTQWVDLQVREAIARGEFDDLPGYGKPIKDLGSDHDPDWWVKQLIEREQITGILPPALQLRKDDLELTARLDRLPAEADVRREVEDFNRRVVEARRQLLGGPPVVTPTREVDDEVEAWRERLERRREEQRRSIAEQARRDAAERSRRRRAAWTLPWRRRGRPPGARDGS